MSADRRAGLASRPHRRATGIPGGRAGLPAKTRTPGSGGIKLIPDTAIHPDQNTTATRTGLPPAVHHNDNPYRLSNREIEVLQLVAAGHSNKEIGQTLNLSALTIRSHLKRTGRKLGTGNRAQMIAHAMRAKTIH